jgi:chitinase
MSCEAHFMLRSVSVFLVSSLLTTGFAAAAPTASSGAIVAYVFPQNNTLQPGQIDARAVTRINYAFANIQNGRMITGFPHDAENLAFLNALKQQNPSLTVLISVGGWLWSKNFSDVALTRESRAVFIDSAMQFIGQYELDGLDIDWEYPGLVGAGNKFRPEDKQNFTLLVKELRERFTRETAETHKHLYLTFAAGTGDEVLANLEPKEIIRYLDYINLMAYDYYEPGSEAITGNHAPLFADPADPKHASSADTVEAYIKAGVPPSQLILGMPFYGHVWGQVPEKNHGLFQPGKPVSNGWAHYSDIEQSMIGHGYTRYWDDKSSVPYVYNAEKRLFVSYEDPQSIAAKCRFVREHHLAGVMFWEYSNDPTGALLHAIDDSLLSHSAQGSAAH